MGKLKIKNISKFISFIIILVLALIIVLITVITLSNKRLSSGTDISSLNSSKYSSKILDEYEQDGKKEEFLSDYNSLQSAVGIYMIDNSTLDENSFTSIVEAVNSKLKSGDFEELGSSKPKAWNGEWKVDSAGVLKFKFDAKSIEPSWAVDADMTDKIILN